MGIFDGCLLACDVDDTIVSSGYINPKNVEKIDFFMNEGGKFSLSTGRAACAVSPIINALNKVSPSVTANGAIIYDFENDCILSETLIAKEDHYIAEIIQKLPNDIGVEIHSGLDALVIKKTQETEDHKNYEEFEPCITTYAEADKRNWNKVVYMCNSAEERAFLKDLVSKEKYSCSFIETSAVIDGRMRYYFEQVPNGVSKISALKDLCKILNIKKGGLFAIGDYYNDLPMIKEADISAATAGAPDDIKEYADYIATTCEDGAVADFIDYLTQKAKNLEI